MDIASPESVKGAVIISGEKGFKSTIEFLRFMWCLEKTLLLKTFEFSLTQHRIPSTSILARNILERSIYLRQHAFCHRIQIVEFHTGEVMFETTYIILRQFSVRFANPYYFNRACMGDVTVKFSGGTYTYSFALLEDQDTVQFPLLGNGLDVSVDVPKINITANGENVLYWPEKKWHEDIPQDTFIKVS